jgi:hypothetical protein
VVYVREIFVCPGGNREETYVVRLLDLNWGLRI